MLGHRFEVQRERHEKSTTPGARARTSSLASVSGRGGKTIARSGKRNWRSREGGSQRTVLRPSAAAACGVGHGEQGQGVGLIDQQHWSRDRRYCPRRPSRSRSRRDCAFAATTQRCARRATARGASATSLAAQVATTRRGRRPWTPSSPEPRAVTIARDGSTLPPSGMPVARGIAPRMRGGAWRRRCSRARGPGATTRRVAP
jgi:hypothetical protein